MGESIVILIHVDAESTGDIEPVIRAARDLQAQVEAAGVRLERPYVTACAGEAAARVLAALGQETDDE